MVNCCKNYDVPLYGAAWIPEKEEEEEDSATESETPSSSAVNRRVVLAGGGGAGRYGISNAIILSSFDFESNSLSDQPVAQLETASGCPYRMAVHPRGEGIVCSFQESCRLFEWNSTTSKDEQTLSLKSSEKSLKQLEDVGQQLAMTFNTQGTLLAVGGEDGTLRVFKWPTMETTLSEANAHSSVKDLDFSPDGKFLVSVGSGPARIWNVATATSVASLPTENGEEFRFCRFSRTTDTDEVVYITTAKEGEDNCIVKWDTSSWKRVSSTRVRRVSIFDPDPTSISSFNVSPDGKLLAVGTNNGDILVMSCASMRVQNVVRKAHSFAVTALAVSVDSRALLSASSDSTARVTLIKDSQRDGVSLWVIVLVILLALILIRNMISQQSIF